MAYLHSGEAAYPIRIGHEWTGTVASIGDGVDDAWLGRRVVGDTMLGCGHCVRCRSGRQHLCADRSEVGIRNGWPGALAEQLRVPASSLYAVPDGVDAATGALIEPGANAWRTVEALGLAAGDRVLIVGAGAIGLLAALIARARGLEVDILGRSESSRRFAESLGFERTWSVEQPPTDRYDGVIDASHDPASPARTVELVEPGGRVAWIGLSGTPEPRRQPADRPRGRHRRRRAQRLTGPRRDDRARGRGARRPIAARRGGGGPRRGRRGPVRSPRSGLGRRPEGPGRPAPLRASRPGPSGSRQPLAAPLPPRRCGA